MYVDAYIYIDTRINNARGMAKNPIVIATGVARDAHVYMYIRIDINTVKLRAGVKEREKMSRKK